MSFFEKYVVPGTLAGIAVFVTVMLFSIISGYFGIWNTRGELGETVTETSMIEPFSTLNISIPARVSVQNSEENSIQIKGPENLVRNINTATRNDALTIGRKNDYSFFSPPYWSPGNVTITLNTTKEIKKLKLTGDTELTASSSIDSDAELVVTGSGRARLENLDAETLEVKITGSGKAVLVGQVERLDIAISGSGNVEAYELISQDVDANITGSGTAQVYPVDTLEARISGSGRIQYKGDPNVDQNITGSGKIEKLD